MPDVRHPVSPAPLSHRDKCVIPKVDAIIELVLRRMGIDLQELCGAERRPVVVDARRIIATLCRDHTSASYPQIARRMGRPTHTSVIAQVKRLRHELDWGPERKVSDTTLRMLYTELNRSATWLVSEVEWRGA